MFKTVNTSELQGVALDWTVAKCEGLTCFGHELTEGILKIALSDGTYENFSLSRNWALGGPIIEREIDAIYRTRTSANTVTWEAMAQGDSDCMGYGPTPLIAAMRCYVASKLGDVVSIPSELI